LGLAEFEFSRALICVRDTGVGPVAVCARSPRVGAVVPGLAVLACCWSLVAARYSFASWRYGRPLRARALTAPSSSHVATLRLSSPWRRVRLHPAPRSAFGRRFAVCGAARTSPCVAELARSGSAAATLVFRSGSTWLTEPIPLSPHSPVSRVSAAARSSVGGVVGFFRRALSLSTKPPCSLVLAHPAFGPACGT
jgi:hypothetical protein